MTNPEESAWVGRWERVRQAALALPEVTVGNVSVGKLAGRAGLPWFDRLGGKRVADYLRLDYAALMASHGFGRVKRDRLVAIVETTLASPPLEAAPAAVRIRPCERISEWGIPEEYPVAVLPLPARVLGLCENEKIVTLGELLNAAESLGERGLLAKPNLGRKSIGELLGLLEALRAGDRERVRRWLPLAENGPGLSVAVAIKRLMADLDVRQRPLLERRIVQGMTLEEAASLFRLTRERVRQIARDFLLGPLQRLLDAFPAQQQELFRRWLEGESPAALLGTFESAADAALADGALRELFSDDPEAVAARLDQELRFEACYEKLRRSADFHRCGENLQTFMDAELPVRMHAAFTDFRFEKPGLVIDHSSGKIAPERPSLRRLVFALLAEEEDAIPATWLLRLVHEAEAFRAVTVDELHARFRGWVARHPEIAGGRVIWNE